MQLVMKTITKNSSKKKKKLERKVKSNKNKVVDEYFVYHLEAMLVYILWSFYFVFL